jgi:hypothetical protein
MDQGILQPCSFRDYYRRFGAEIEINALDGRSRPPGEKLPDGIFYISQMLASKLQSRVEVAKWHHTHHNTGWVVKPDSSCGMEVCSPVSKGTKGLDNICRVVEYLHDDPLVVADERCSFHVHVEVNDLSSDELASVLAYWVKCETVFLDSTPPLRKRNRYCQQLGISDIFEHDSTFTPNQLIAKLSTYKYFSLNTYHFYKGRRPTIEFRIAENQACRSPHYVRNWIRLIIHFVECAKKTPFPGPYQEGNPWSSYLWLEPKDVFTFLGFRPGQSKLSPEMAQTRDWLLVRLLLNITPTGLPGVWSDEVRSAAHEQVIELANELQINSGNSTI